MCNLTSLLFLSTSSECRMWMYCGGTMRRQSQEFFVRFGCAGNA